MRRRLFLSSVAALSVSGVRAAPVSVSVLVGLKDWSLRNDPRLAAAVTKYHATLGKMQGAFIKAIEWVLPDKTTAPAFIRDVMATGLATHAEIDEIKMAPAPVVPDDPLIGPSNGQQWYVIRSASSGTINLGPTTDATSAWGRLNAVNSSITYGDSAVKVGDVNGGYTAPSSDGIPNLGTGWNGALGNTNTADVQGVAQGCAFGHGTICAMILGAATNNTTLVAGVAAGCTFYPYVCATNPGATCPAGGGSLSYSASWIVSCLSAAVTAGIHALSITVASTSDFGATVTVALAAAWNAGIFICTPSGDLGAGGNPVEYPCFATSPAICTGGISITGAVSDFSGTSNAVALISPGGNQTTPSGVSMPIVHYDGTTTGGAGTSLACPILAGVAGLVCSANSHVRGNPTAITEILLASCAPISGQVGWNKSAGLGLVQADKAVAMAIAGSWPNNQGGLLGVQ